MKKLLLLCLLTASSMVTFAQTSKSTENTAKFSVGVEAGLPLGSFSDAYNFGIGGSLKYELSVTKDWFVGLSAGYTNFSGKTFSGFTVPSAGFVPVKLGGKYYFNKSIFGEGQLGVVFSTQSGGGSAFVYSPGVGYSFDNGLEAGIRYEAWSNNGTLSQLGLRVAYKF